MEISSIKFCRAILLLFAFNVFLGSAEKGCTPAEMDQENLKKLAYANNRFALNLYQKISADSSENIFFSPLSISTAFGMLFYGAKGNTSEELRSVLGYEEANLPSELVHSSFNHFITEALPASDTKNPEYVLNLANAVLLDKKLELISTYKSEVQKLYQASVQDVDFVKDGANIVNEINSWVKAKTNNKIDHLLDELSPSTVMVLLNAVYFKGTWKTEFQKEKTFPEKFYNDGLESGASDIPMMHIKAKFPYTQVFDVQALELPYKGENISMVILLPTQRDGLDSLEKNLTPEKLATIRKQLSRETVIVSLPKFKIQYSRELSSDIQNLGAKSIFNAVSSDFSGMTSQKNIFVSQVLHKAVVEVNEEGSEAAAVTGIISNRMRPMLDTTPEFIADHPFLFSIIDNRSDMILFAGRVNNL